MRSFPSEAVAKEKINAILMSAGCQSTASYYKDDQPANTLIRTVVFRAPIDAEDESVINAVAGIGSNPEIDRAIVYRGGQIDTEKGEVRYLFFEAKINPFEED